MRPSEAARRLIRESRRTAGAALLMAAAAALATAPCSAATPDELAAARQESIAAAREAQQCERAVAAIRYEIDLLGRDADARRRGLEESRTEQARLLGALLHLARNPLGEGFAASGPLIDRARGEMLMQAAEPALRAQASALTGEIGRVAALRQRIVEKQEGEAVARQALATERERLAAAVERRNALAREMVPPQNLDAALGIADIEREASDFADLIKRAEAAAERRNKKAVALTGSARSKKTNPPRSEAVDPTRPSDLRSLVQEAGLQEAGDREPGDREAGAEQAAAPPRAPLVAPVAGKIVRRAGDPGRPNDGVHLRAVAGAAVIAPFDGRVAYAGPFRNLGLVLIIRHDHLYSSMLVGLNRIDAKLDDWVLAGEPVGAMADVPVPRSRPEAEEAGEADPGRLLYLELRRDGHPVDPQSWLASDDDGRDERNGEQRVRQ